VITIETQVTAFRRSSFDVEHRVFRADGQLAIEARETRVWAARHSDDPDRIKGVPIPDEVLATLGAVN
jgi:4-hydroxybenzoyl-CoA thioesterase